MKSSILLVMSLTVLLSWNSHQGMAQDGSDATEAEHQAAVSLFDNLNRLSQQLQQSPGYQLQVTNRWSTSLDGVSQARGKHELKLSVGSPNQIRLTVASGNANPPQLLLVSDGDQMTRWYAPENVYTRHAVTQARQEARHCQFTSEVLTMAGADFLLNPGLVEEIRSQLRHVSDQGIESGLRHFHLELNDGRQIELWNTNDEVGIPVKLTTRRNVATSDNRQSQFESQTELKWNQSPQFDAQEFVADIPADATRVTNLHDAIMGQDASQLIGRNAPQVKLLDAAGQTVDLKSGKPTVLYFWATWAAPSVAELKDMKPFVEQIKAAGVSTLPVNVAQSAEQVAAFVKENAIETSVARDADGRAANAFRLTELPAVVILDPAGKVRAVMQKVNADSRPQIRQTLEAMTRTAGR